MSVKVASTANVVTLSGLLTLDGITLVEGDLVLLKDQTTGTQNGVYVASSGAWSRDTNLLATGSNAYNIDIYVRSGTLNGGNTYNCVTSPGVVGTNSLVFNIYSNPYKLFWQSSACGTPATGQQITGVLGGSAAYQNALDGVWLTTATNNQIGTINWNVTGFDFTKDFQLSVCLYQGTGADGVQFGVGGSSAFGLLETTANGGLGFSYNTYSVNNNDNFRINGVVTGITMTFRFNVTYTNRWFTSRMLVRTFGTKRYAFIYTGSNNSLCNSIDVTTWIPAGTFVGVCGRTGGINALHACNFVSLEYL